MPDLLAVVERVDHTDEPTGRRFVITVSNREGVQQFTTFDALKASLCDRAHQQQRMVRLEWEPVTWNQRRWRAFFRREGKQLTRVVLMRGDGANPLTAA
jgi:hypothetical protein